MCLVLTPIKKLCANYYFVLSTKYSSFQKESYSFLPKQKAAAIMSVRNQLDEFDHLMSNDAMPPGLFESPSKPARVKTPTPKKKSNVYTFGSPAFGSPLKPPPRRKFAGKSPAEQREPQSSSRVDKRNSMASVLSTPVSPSPSPNKRRPSKENSSKSLATTSASPSPSKRRRRIEENLENSLSFRSLNAWNKNSGRSRSGESANRENLSPNNDILPNVTQSASRIEKRILSREKRELRQVAQEVEFEDYDHSDPAYTVAERSQAEMFGIPTRTEEEEHEVEMEEEENADDNSNNIQQEEMHILTVGNVLQTTGKPNSREFDAEVKALKNDAGRSIDKLDRDVSFFRLVAFLSFLYSKNMNHSRTKCLLKWGRMWSFVMSELSKSFKKSKDTQS